MRWFRHRIGLGVGLALTALALQLALTLGHSHAGELYGHTAAAHAQHETQPDEASPADHQHAPGDFCPDCFVLAQVATGLTAAPPVLPAPATLNAPPAVLRILSDTPARVRAGFQPRAPPRS